VTGAFARITDDLGREARALRFSGRQAQLAACASLGGAGAVLLALALHLDNPWWAGISAVSVLQAERRATMTRAAERVLGTLIGAGIGILLAPLVAWHIPFSIACAVVAGFTIYAQERTTRSYAILLGGVTALLVLFGTLQSPTQALHLGVDRGLEIGVGVLAASLVSYVLHPEGQDGAVAGARPGIWRRPVDVELLGIALAGAVAVAAIPSIWTTLELPALGQTPITAFVVTTAMRSDARLKALARLIGCLLGGVCGIAAIGIVGDAFIPWLAWLTIGLYLAGFLQHGGGDAGYVGQQAAVALIMSMVEGPAASPDILPPIDRLTGIAGGIVIVSLVMAILDPLRLRFFPANGGSHAA
jgi:uncharacterized membrane protein YccC